MTRATVNNPGDSAGTEGAILGQAAEGFERVAGRGTVAIHTHGCKLNQADSSLLAQQFREAGYRIVERVREADIYVLNTCTVTATADAKARQALRAAHRANPDALIVAAGCYPQRAAVELSQLPGVSLVVGNQEKNRLVALIGAARQDLSASARLIGWENRHSPLAALGDWPNVPFNPAQSSNLSPTLANLPGRSRAMIKIQEGCDQVCAYCIVPKVRGRERSIPSHEIIEQIQQRVNAGVQEVVLTGTQLGTYGFDLPGINLVALIRAILAQTAVARLRVSSLQPQEIGPELLQLWLDDRRLCPHFHLPLQSGSDVILKAMRRRYTKSQFMERVALIRQALPDAGITADLIVGFPGEGEGEFAESMTLAAALGFSDLHAFPYSKRPGTSAAHREDQVPAPVKKERMGRALAVARQSFVQFRLQQLGQIRPVLWEGTAKIDSLGYETTQWRGLTDNYIRVHAVETSRPEDRRNTITAAKLVEFCDNSVLAEPS